MPIFNFIGHMDLFAKMEKEFIGGEKYIYKRVRLFIHQTIKKNISFMIFNKIKQVSFYKSVEAHTSINTDRTRGIIKKRLKSHQKNISRECT